MALPAPLRHHPLVGQNERGRRMDLQTIAPTARLNQFFRISRLLAGQLDFQSAIRAVATEIAAIVPHDHLDVCIVRLDGKLHTAYETGIETAWGSQPMAPVEYSPIRSLLLGQVGHILSADATIDPRFQFEGGFVKPIHDHGLRSRLHLPMIVHGEIIGALSCSLLEPGRYGPDDIRNGHYIAELLSPYFYALRAAEQARQSAIVETEARAREEGLRQGALKLTEALEAERQRIGMDLHDQTLADMTRLARRLERLNHAQSLSPDDLTPVIQGLQHSMQSLRQIIEAAKPSVLHLFGFAHAVENHLDAAIRDSGQALTGSLTDSSQGALDALPPAVAIALFRITQEAVNNAVHHAQARTVDVLLTAAKGQITVKVRDDGVGLARPRSRSVGGTGGVGASGVGSGGVGSGSGIDNMKTRARLISARFSLASGPGGVGTQVTLGLVAPERT